MHYSLKCVLPGWAHLYYVMWIHFDHVHTLLMSITDSQSRAHADKRSALYACMGRSIGQKILLQALIKLTHTRYHVYLIRKKYQNHDSLTLVKLWTADILITMLLFYSLWLQTVLMTRGPLGPLLLNVNKSYITDYNNEANVKLLQWNSKRHCTILVSWYEYILIQYKIYESYSSYIFPMRPRLCYKLIPIPIVKITSKNLKLPETDTAKMIIYAHWLHYE